MKKNKVTSFLLRDVFSMTRLTASSELILFSLTRVKTITRVQCVKSWIHGSVNSRRTKITESLVISRIGVSA